MIGLQTATRELDALEAVYALDPPAALGLLRCYLDSERRSMPLAEWRRCCGLFRIHPFFRRVQASPLVQRALERPRGMTADAVFLDMLQMPEAVESRLDRESRDIFLWEAATAIGQTARSRVDYLARALDAAAAVPGTARVLAVGGGHMREAQMSAETRLGRLAELTVLDGDAKALATVQSQQPNVRVACVSAGQVMEGAVNFGQYNLIYCARLLEDLPQASAARLVRELFLRLMPGGRLLLINTSPGFPYAAYIEACMDWWIEYRSDASMRDLTALLPPDQVGVVQVASSMTSYLSSLSVRRKA